MSQEDVTEQIARRSVHDTVSLNAIDERVDALETADLDARVEVLEDPGA